MHGATLGDIPQSFPLIVVEVAVRGVDADVEVLDDEQDVRVWATPRVGD